MKMIKNNSAVMADTTSDLWEKIDGCNKQLDAIVTAAEKSDVVLFGTTDYYY